MICIVDYGAANIKSVFNIFDFLGVSVCVSDDTNIIKDATHLVIPGVGSFPSAFSQLKSKGLIDSLNYCAFQQGKPILGICLGMQMMASISEEDGPTPGLNWIPGSVKRFELDSLHIPHIGWNDVMIKNDHELFKDIQQIDRSFYFVHSYYFLPENKEHIIGTTNYGNEFTSIILKNNIVATQFHPEKSQENGIKFLENFVDWKV